MLARENPHCGVSGVPFMNSTTGAEEMAEVMAARVSEERPRRRIVVLALGFWNAAERGVWVARMACVGDERDG